MKRFISACLSFLLIFSSFAFIASADKNKLETNLPPRLKPEFVIHEFDFETDQVSKYARNPAVSISNMAGFKVSDGQLLSSDADCAFGSAVFVGDDYGMSQGYLEFTPTVVSGEFEFGIRLSMVNADRSERGVRIGISPSGSITVSESESGLEYSFESGIDFSTGACVRYDEYITHGVVSVNGNEIFTLDFSQGKIALKQNGEVKAEKDGCKLYDSGYFSLVLNGFEGRIDDLSFTNCTVDQSLPQAETREIDYSCWVATDDLLRSTPTNEDVGGVKDDKYVGLFYFLCWVGAGQIVQDNTKIYLESGVDGLKDYIINKGGEAYWAEPYFGYYLNTDTWVYRKHAYMLDAAGVDFIFLDVSNAVTFNEGHLALFDTWLEIRKEGGTTPQIVFFNGDNTSTLNSNIKQLKTTVYSAKGMEKYKELFFMWEGKPLIFGNITGKELTDESREFLKDFTVRGSWAWVDKDGYWSWLQEYSKLPSGKIKCSAGGLGRDWEGNFEALSVCLGHHASSSKGRSFLYGNEPDEARGNFGFNVKTAGEGICFESQFAAVRQYDPSVMLITGWNEWIAGCFKDGNSSTVGSTQLNGYLYVDQFTPEFSRDAEPMRLRDGSGFGDNYYYQMVSYIREFKGMKETEKATGQAGLDIRDISAWDTVYPEYRDSIGDTELRNSVCYDKSYRYVNGTGRNDIDYAKVSQDSEYLYFLVKCTHDITPPTDDAWMNLYINADLDPDTGWEGYDYIVNRQRDSSRAAVEKVEKGSFEGEKIADCEYYLEGQYLVLKIKKADLGLTEAKEIYFKWSDNSTRDGNVMEFMDLGDAAPNDRYSFRYLGYAGEDMKAEDTEGSTAAETDPTDNASQDDSSALIIAVGIIAAAIGIAVVIVIKRRS